MQSVRFTGANTLARPYRPAGTRYASIAGRAPLLIQRVASAVVAIPIIFLLILVGGWAYAIVVAIALAIAAAEFEHLRHAWLSRWTFGAAFLVGCTAIATQAVGGEAALVVAVVAGTLAGAGVMFALATRGSNGLAVSELPAPSWTAAGIVYVGGLGSTIVLLRELPSGRDWVYLALFSTFAVDTAAYFVGSAFGRHKMAPRISPKKTWEGFAGGYAGGLAAVLLLNYALGLRVGAAEIVLLAALLPVAAAVGDLAESALKRATQVKDASDLIPGHGGVLDRLDSVLFTFALTWIVARFVVG